LSSVDIREAGQDDLDAIEALEREIFPSPWSRGMLADELGDDPRRIPLLASLDGEPVGFAFCWRVEEELHLINLGVLPGHRRRGVAQAILDGLLVHPRARGARVVTLEVRSTNEAALRFYRKNDFLEIALRREYYPDTREDAVIMLRSLEPARGEEPV
jgi:ribosomal-protein-alanine N-acetyltransferase